MQKNQTTGWDHAIFCESLRPNEVEPTGQQQALESGLIKKWGMVSFVWIRP